MSASCASPGVWHAAPKASVGVGASSHRRGVDRARTPGHPRVVFRSLTPLAVLALLVAAPAHAAAPAARPADAPAAPIVVTGKRLTPAEVRARALSYTALVGTAAAERPVARWTDPVCVRVLNLDDRYAAIVGARLRVVAAAVGVPLARGRCTPNIVVTFAADAGAVVNRIATRFPRSFADLDPPARAALRSGDAPVRWWYATSTRDRDGRAATANLPAWSQGGGSILPDVQSIATYSDSLISTQAVRVLTAATIVVDIDRATGRSLAAVADYVALVALAEIRAEAPPPQGSVLGLFAGDDAAGLGDGDAAFLRALYAMPLDRVARQQRSKLIQALTAAPPGG